MSFIRVNDTTNPSKKYFLFTLTIDVSFRWIYLHYFWMWWNVVLIETGLIWVLCHYICTYSKRNHINGLNHTVRERNAAHFQTELVWKELQVGGFWAEWSAADCRCWKAISPLGFSVSLECSVWAHRIDYQGTWRDEIEERVILKQFGWWSVQGDRLNGWFVVAVAVLAHHIFTHTFLHLHVNNVPICSFLYSLYTMVGCYIWKIWISL